MRSRSGSERLGHGSGTLCQPTRTTHGTPYPRSTPPCDRASTRPGALEIEANAACHQAASVSLSRYPLSNLIKQIKPKRDYIWNLNGVCRTMTTAFTPDMLAYLRSDSSIQKLFDEHANSGRAEWQTNYLTEATRRSA